MKKIWSVIALALLGTSFASAQEEIEIDWATKSLKRYPARLEPLIPVVIVIKGINDYLYSYRGSLRVDPIAESSIDPSSLPGGRVNLSSLVVGDCKIFDDAAKVVDDGLTADFTLTKEDGVYPSRKMEESKKAWKAIELSYKLLEAAPAAGQSCASWKTYNTANRKKAQRLARADSGTHEERIPSTIPENGRVTVTVTEYYADELTKDGSKEYAFQAGSGRFFLSVGFLATQVQARSYDVVDVGVIRGTPAVAATATTPAVPAVTDQTTKELRIQGTGLFRPTTAVLLNYRMPFDRFWSPSKGIALSAGPVYRIAQSGTATNASNWGIFAGLSFHLWERMWLTPGFHIGEFSDLPRGFTAASGIRVPDGFPTTFSGVNRWTTRWGIGITFRAADFKSALSVIANTSTPAAAGKQPGAGGAATPIGKTSTDATPNTTPQANVPSTPSKCANVATAGELTAQITALKDCLAASQRALADADTALVGETAAREAAQNARTLASQTLELKKTQESSLEASSKLAAQEVKTATTNLLNGSVPERPALQTLLDSAQTKLQNASEALGKARSATEAAQADLTASNQRLVAANLLLSAATAKKAAAQSLVTALEVELKSVRDAAGVKQ